MKGLSKRFVMRKDNSLKERIVTLGRAGRRHREDFWALRDIDLSITAGSTIGLLGPNGSGKSTLLKTVGGIIQPTTGTVSKRGRLAALLELGAGFHPDLTGRENVYLNASILGFSQKDTARNFDSIVDFSGIGEFIDTQVKFYSSGMYVRLAFAVAIHMDPDILLVDEVLAVGDEAFQRKCLDKIRQFQAEGRTIVLVSHSAGQVTELCTRAVLLEHGRIVFDGDPTAAVDSLRDVLSEGAGALSDESKGSRITALELLDASGASALTFDAGSDLTVRVAARNASILDNWRITVSLEVPSGQRAIATNTDLLGMDLPPLGPDGTSIAVTFKELRLGAGMYSLYAHLFDGEGRRLDTANLGDHFHMRGNAQVRGLVDNDDVSARVL